MGEFFKPWRRKIGAVTLVVATMGVGFWVRGMTLCDLASARIELDEYFLASTRGKLLWTHVSYVTEDELRNVPKGASFLTWHNHGSLETEAFWTPNYLSREHKRTELLGFGYSQGEIWEFGGPWDANPPDHNERKYWKAKIPLWSIVVPLTLLAAYLLLSKLQSPKAKIEPDPSKA